MANPFVTNLSAHGPTHTRTENGALTLSTSGQPIVDLFFQAGASRNKDITRLFDLALNENQELAGRLALWARDVRGGAGERKTFRDMLLHLEKFYPELAIKMLPKIPEVGRYDDLLIFTNPVVRNAAFTVFKKGLDEGNGLAGKWAPRKGEVAVALRNFLGLTPKAYRKLIVGLTKVIETQMASKKWDEINFNHTPSQAARKYRKAFFRHQEDRYKQWLADLADPNKVKSGAVKVNAGAIFPHDVCKVLWRNGSVSDLQLAEAQWAALPDFVGEGSFIPLCDVSGSMTSHIAPGVSAMEVSVALGVYCAGRNKSEFKDVILTFESNPKILKLSGDLRQRYGQVRHCLHMGSTNLEAAFKAILDHGKRYSVSADDMPKSLIIFSDMEFNQTCNDLTNHDRMKQMFEQAGYNIPNVVFWNLNGRTVNNNTPVSFNERGTALVSGFSPSTMQNVLSGGSKTPLDIVLDVIMKDRYAF